MVVEVSQRRAVLRARLSEPNVCPSAEHTPCDSPARQGQHKMTKGCSSSRLGLEIARQGVPVDQPLTADNTSRLALCENIQQRGLREII